MQVSKFQIKKLENEDKTFLNLIFNETKAEIKSCLVIDISLPSHYAESNIKGLKPAVCHTKPLVRKMHPV